jgi:hypothetical protein
MTDKAKAETQQPESENAALRRVLQNVVACFEEYGGVLQVLERV